LLTGQQPEGGTDARLALAHVERVVRRRRRIGRVERPRLLDRVLAAAPQQVDAPVAGDAKQPAANRGLLAVEQVGLLPPDGHHVLGELVGETMIEPQTQQVGVDTRSVEVEQARESIAVALGRDRCDQIRVVVRRRHPRCHSVRQITASRHMRNDRPALHTLVSAGGFPVRSSGVLRPKPSARVTHLNPPSRFSRIYMYLWRYWFQTFRGRACPGAAAQGYSAHSLPISLTISPDLSRIAPK